MDKKIPSAKWKQLKGKARERWGKITNDEMDVINGETDQLIGKIEEKYQTKRADAEKDVREWYQQHIGHAGKQQKSKSSDSSSKISGANDKEGLVRRLQRL